MIEVSLKYQVCAFHFFKQIHIPVKHSTTMPLTESTAGDSDTESVTSDKAKRTKVVLDAVRYRWTSELEFVASTLACISSVTAFDAFVMTEDQKMGKLRRE